MTTLPIREMVLYKHGVGFFIRQGAMSGNDAALIFRADEINDVLKSLTVFDQAGGQVLGIHYPTPMNRDERLKTSSIDLSNTSTVTDLIQQMRGRKASFSIESTPGTVETVRGRIVGLDQPMGAAPYGGRAPQLELTRVPILTDDGQIRVVLLSDVGALTIDDETAAHDLTYFLDTSVGDDQRRTVNVQLSDGDHDLVVQYVAPSPTWRVSYRLVAEQEADSGGERGNALLQGWGLFDNRFDEDLNEVTLTLVAGQPISFVYELYTSAIPKRPMVRDLVRIAPMPIEYEGAMDSLEEEFDEPEQERERGIMRAKAMPPSPAPMMLEQPSMGRMRATGARSVKAQQSLADVELSAPSQAVGTEVGEFFQYAVTTPVTVKRGESALVPIFNVRVAYQRELLYNGDKLPTHPVAALRFPNQTGLTLERGPVTVVEDGDYKGEAIVRFTVAERDVYLPYAVELGIKITEKIETKNVIAGLTVQDSYLRYENYSQDTITYVIENTLQKAAVVTLERSVEDGRTLFETPAPDIESAADRRWRVPVGGKSRKTFIVTERMRHETLEYVRNLSLTRLAEFLRNRWIDEALNKQLKAVIEQVKLVNELNAETTALGKERETIFKRQEQVRANLGALQSTGQEAALRKRMLGQLEATEDRLSAIDTRLETIRTMLVEKEALIAKLIEVLK